MKKVFFVLSLFMLAGCSRGDPALQLTLYDIKALCAPAGDAAFARANDGNKDANTLGLIQGGTVAQCELEYRIKQHEANKPF